MSKLRVDQLEDIAGSATINVADLVSTSSTITTESGTQTLVQAFNDRALKADTVASADLYVTADVTLNIPTDYSTLQSAIDDYSIKVLKDGVTVELMIESGHQPSSGVSVTGGNYSGFKISSVDAEVTLSPTFDQAEDFVAVTHGEAPILNCLINANGRARYGVNCQLGSNAYITPGSGVKNCNQRGLYANYHSSVIADGTIWTGTGSVAATGLVRAAWIARGSTLIAENADFSNSTGMGIYVSRASTVHAMDVKVQNCDDLAIWVHRSSRLTAHSVGNGGVLISTSASCTSPTVRAQRGSTIALNADAGTAPVTITQNGSGDGVTVVASIADLTSATITGGSSSADGLSASGGATINAPSTNISGFDNNIYANGGTIVATLSTASGARSFGALANRGEITLSAASVTGSTTKDINIANGSFVRADGCTTTSGSPAIGDTNRPAFNSLAAPGVIFS